MRTRTSILVLFIFAVAAASHGAEDEPKYLLADGFVLRKVAGRLTGPESNEAAPHRWSGWFFEPGSDVSDGRGSVKAGAKLELLPSATLEKMTTDATSRSGAEYELQGRVTKYKGENFVFPTGFSPVEVTSGQGSAPEEPSQPEDLQAKEPNDVVTIPAEVMDKLQPAERVGRTAVEGGFYAGQDHLIVERTGSLTDAGDKCPGPGCKAAFVADGLGRNLAEARFELLPCETLERAEEQQSAGLDRPRFKIGGIGSEYQGKQYMLLHKVGRAYGHGNFPK
jgi:hypothetical protein